LGGPPIAQRRRPGRFSRRVAAILLLLAAGPAMAAPRGLDAFILAYECPVAVRLAAIHERGDMHREDSRFLILAVHKSGPAYVQCAFFDNDRQMMCEAASGFYDTSPGTPSQVHLPAAKVAKLGKLGFSTDASHGNFQRVMDTSNAEGLSAVARLLLSALYEAYDARIDDSIKVTAPLLPESRPTLDRGLCSVD